MGLLDLSEVRRQTIRGPVNPLDKSTVVSIYPKEIDEVKYTIQPGKFHINAGTFESPAILVVGPSSWWREIDEHQPLLEIPNSSIQVADSIVKDYCNGLLGCNMGDAMPGLFFIPGEITLKDVQTKYSKELNNAKVRQDNWYQTLVKIADSLWARTNGNPLTVSDDMRLAARELNLKSKDWMKDFSMIDMVKCFACGNMVNPDFPICPNCKVIRDAKKAAELGIKFAS